MYEHENEEILSDRLNVEEVQEQIPAEETPAEVPAEEIAEEIPAEAPVEEIAEENPAEVPVEEIAEETPEEAAPVEQLPEEIPKESTPVEEKPKKKALPWILGIIGGLLALLLVLAAVCCFWINPYFARKNAYEQGLACLEQRDFDGALEGFRKAGSYKDAPVYYEDLQGKECQYSMAVMGMEDGEYTQALEVLETLDDYKNAAALAQDCLYELAAASLAQRKVEEAYLYADRMEQATYERFLQHYIISYGDLQVFTILEQLLITRQEDEGNSSLNAYEILRTENDGLANLTALPAFADPALEELIALYMEGVTQQFAACKESGYFDNRSFYEGAYKRASAIEQLMEQYDFLSENESLAQAFQGAAANITALLDMQTALENMRIDHETVGADKKHYLPFHNTSETAALVKFVTYCYKGAEYLSNTEAYLTILPGETVFIPLGRPSGCDNWVMDWFFQTVYPETEQTLQTGVYKLQSVISDGTFYSLEALEPLGLTPEGLVVSIQGDGVGSWKEMGEETAFGYSADLFAVDGTDQRLPYKTAGGKLVVTVDTDTYVLALESVTP